MAPSRENAKALIMAGQVYVNEQKADKPGQSVPEDAKIVVRGDFCPYVSRGGLKLEKAIAQFALDPKGLICMDVGASTGGFTDCMLQNGAQKVYAIDVGYNQLAWSLRSDPRVICLERTNFRYVTSELVSDPVAFASVDVSFISLSIILPVLHSLLHAGGDAVCLIKPQFEAGREKVGKNGVVRDAATHIEVVEKVLRIAREAGFSVLNLDYSPIQGPKGNIEYLAHLQRGAAEEPLLDVEALVMQAHRHFTAPACKDSNLEGNSSALT